jgi:hypothetical protein
MKHATMVVLVCVLSCLVVDIAAAQPSITSGTGLVGFQLSSYGRLRVGPNDFSSTLRELDRVTFIAGLDIAHVFDYMEDADTTSEAAHMSTMAKVDSVAECVCNNGYTNLPPKIRVRNTVLYWYNKKFLIERFTAINDSSAAMSLYLGAVVVPKVGAAYGGETIKYDTTKKVAYCYREGLASYWGMKLLGKPTYSVKIKDWDDYSLNPDADEATDSTRFLMTSDKVSDLLLTAGSNGSIYEVNAGKFTLASHDSVQLFYAITYGATAAEAIQWADSAAARYTSITTSVARPQPAVPEQCILDQNYPNPFNPSTTMRFTVDRSRHVLMTVTDVLGRTVATLVNETVPSGVYDVTWNAASMPSGIYFCSMRSGDFFTTKRLVLAK